MNNLFAREPLFNLKKELFAHQFIYRDEVNGALPLDLSAFTLTDEQHANLNIDDLMQVGSTIVNICVNSIKGFIEAFSAQNIIVELSDLPKYPNESIIDDIKELKKQGFKIVIMQVNAHNAQLADMADFIKCELSSSTPNEISSLKETISNSNIKIIASQVHSQFQFEQCQKLNVDYVQGFFFLEYREGQNKPLPANKLAYLQLMTEIAKPELQINDLQKVFEHDPTLSFLLIKFINNPLVNKSFKITSIRHALNFLGELMVRRFVAIVSLAGLNSEQANELLNLSLSRAKYCELVDANIADSTDPMSAFLVGLFSLLDIILERPLPELLRDLELDDKIMNALIAKSGLFYDILASAKAMESGDWASLYNSALALDISQEVLFEKHRQSVSWQNDMTQAVSLSFPVARVQAG